MGPAAPATTSCPLARFLVHISFEAKPVGYAGSWSAFTDGPVD